MVLVGSTHCCVSNILQKSNCERLFDSNTKWRCYVVNSASKKAHYQIIGSHGGVKKRRDQYIVSWLNPADRLDIWSQLLRGWIWFPLSLGEGKKMAILAKNIVDCIFKVHDREIRMLPIMGMKRACKLWEQIRFSFHMHRSLVVWCSWTNAIWLC